ncbi:MAG: hypothetical protein AAF311_11235 [Pseudomonadota bacterium]
MQTHSRTRAARTIVAAALAGTTLSGCAVLGNAADRIWSGTEKTYAFLMTPVGELLRGAPEQDVQFAEADADETEASTTLVAEANTDIQGDASDWVDVEAFTENAPVMADAELETVVAETQVVEASLDMPAVTRVETVTGTTVRPAVMSRTETTHMDMSHSVSFEDSYTVGNVTLGDISHVSMGGSASLDDWRACEARAGGYWTFDEGSLVGRIKPEFERCMSDQDYKVETTIRTETIPAPEGSTVTTVSTLP